MKPATRLLLWLAGWLVALAILAAVTVLVTVTQSRRALEATRADLERRGETLSITALIPPDPPREDNGADAMIAASREIVEITRSNDTKRVTIGQKKTDPGFAEVLHKRVAAIRREDDVPWSEVSAGLLPMRDRFDALRVAARSKHVEAHPDYTRGFTLSLDSVNPLLTAAQHLSINALFLLQENRTSEAAEDIITLLRMSELPGRQPVLICQLIAASIVGMAQINTWEALQSGMSADDLARLQAAWEQSRRPDAIAKTLRMERAMAGPMFEEYFRSMGISSMTTAPYSALPSSFAELGSMISFAAWKYIFRHSDERQFLLNYQELINCIPPTPGGNWRQVLEKSAEIESALAGAGIGRMFSSTVIPALRTSLKRFATTDTVRNLTITAIAIRRFQIAHAGALPQSLESLVPEFLVSVPEDPINGKLHYKPLPGNTFLLYGNGVDGIDNGGDATSAPRTHSILDRTDIVWPQVASEKERPEKKPADTAP